MTLRRKANAILIVSIISSFIWILLWRNNAEKLYERKSHASIDIRTDHPTTTTIHHVHGQTKISTPTTYQSNKNLDNNVCQLTWTFPNINITHYEYNDVKRMTSEVGTPRKKAKPLFKNPEIPLNPDKFLYPAGRWGPNNQMLGFLESIFVAITLNRTLVLPRFMKHDRDKQRHSTNYVSPTHRIDVESYCKFVSCITLESFQKTCGYQIDGILNTKFLQFKEKLSIEKDMGMKIPQNYSISETSQLTKFLIPQNGTSKEKPELTFTPEEMVAYFTSEARCVVYPFPFADLRTTTIEKKRVMIRGWLTHHLKAADEEYPGGAKMYKSILQHYKRPLYIRQITDHFIQNVTRGKPFLSIHWRYNEGEFLSDNHCNKKEGNQKLCQKARAFTVQDLANKIQEKINLMNKMGVNISHVYLATPLDISVLYDNLTKVFLMSNQKITIHSSGELIQFIKSNYVNCKFIPLHFDDIISSTEMEICSRGVVFIGSIGTTWTSNVEASRYFGNIAGTKPEFDSILFEI